MDKYEHLSVEEITALQVEKTEALQALFALDAPTVAQVQEATALGAEIDEINAEITTRNELATQAAADFAALKDKFSNTPPEAPADEEGEPAADPADEEVPEEETPVEDKGDEGAAKTTSARNTSVVTLARKTPRPPVPRDEAPRVSLTASADVPGFPASSRLNGVEDLAAAVIARSAGFTPPSGDGKTENLQKFGVASIKRPFSKELTIDRQSDDMAVIDFATKESRLPGNSLVAAGGWCAPSETMYDLCAGETTEGLISVPEVNIKRGGINYTRGPDFADFYGNSSGMFKQTESQAISGTTKPCVTVDCPSFQEVRMDAIGLCIKIPILTNSTYPELIQRYVSGFLTAYEHRVNVEVINRMLALTPAARTAVGLGSSVDDSLAGLILIADQRRQQRRLSMTQSFEVILPFWVRNMFLADLRRRTGFDGPAAQSVMDAEFRAANLNVQWVYDWQLLPTTDIGGTTGYDEANEYPKTYQALMYPAGTFIKGTHDVINLSAVYDAASLAVNVYTGLFMEEGLLVAKMCNDSDLITLPVCNAGRRGAENFTCA